MMQSKLVNKEMASEDRNELIAQAVALGLSEDQVKRYPTYEIKSIIKAKQHVLRPAPLHPLTPEDEKHTTTGGEDTVTEIDLEFSRTGNPADNKYKRFQQLHKLKSELLKGIRLNSEALKTYQPLLESDDVIHLKAEIDHDQGQLSLVLEEMAEIHVWFNEVHEQRRQLYQTLCDNTVDFSGKLKDHFQRKMENIQVYMAALKEKLSN
jgi:hypothetical protein